MRLGIAAPAGFAAAGCVIADAAVDWLDEDAAAAGIDATGALAAGTEAIALAWLVEAAVADAVAEAFMLAEVDALAAALDAGLLAAGAVTIAPEELVLGSFALPLPGAAIANISNDSGKHFMRPP